LFRPIIKVTKKFGFCGDAGSITKNPTFMVGFFILVRPFSNYVGGLFLCCGRDSYNKIPVISIFGCCEGQEVEDELL